MPPGTGAKVYSEIESNSILLPMKKRLLFALALSAIGSCAFAAGPYVREAGKGGFKAITPRPARTAAIAKSPARAAAPDNAVEALPFNSPLGKNDTRMDDYTIIDANHDNRSWNVKTASYAACMGPNTADFQTADDWLVSPPIHLYKDKTYLFKIEATGMSTAAKTADFAFFMGDAPTVEAMTTTIVEKKTYPGGSIYTKVEQQFTVPADGYYYFGFHCTTDKAVNTTSRLKNFAIEEYAAPVDAPAAGTIEYSRRPKGELTIDVTYTAPTKTKSGADLTEISKIEIYNWISPKADYFTVENPEPGKTYTCAVPALEGGNNRLRAVAYTGETPGDMAETANFHVGKDMPGDPSNIRATLSDDFTKVTLTWDPVSETGENGGYVDPAEVKYYIFDAFGSYYDPALAEEVTSPYTFDYSAAKEQDFMAYQITAGNDKGYSMGEYSNVVVIGKPSPTPWNESFTDCYYGAAWMQDLSTSGNVMTSLFYDGELQTNSDAPEGTEPEYIDSHDLDNGFLLMLPYAKDDCFGLNSVKVDISGASKPVFEFHYQGMGSRLEALVAREEGDFETVRDIDLKAEPTAGWTLCRVPLDAYKSARYVRVGFRMTAVHNTDETTWSVPVDNFRVIDLADVDLRLSYANIMPLEAGKPSDVKISMENMGTATASNAAMRLYVDDEIVAEKTVGDMAAGAVVSHTLAFTPGPLHPDKVAVRCEVVADADASEGNNAAGPVDINIKHSDLPGVADLAADKAEDNAVQLSWTAPDYASFAQPRTVTDDLESVDYPDFDAVKAGDWTFNDLDRQRNYTWLHDYDNPYRGIAMGFQIFTRSKAGLPEEELVEIPPHSGDRLFVAWGASRNDNWLISPLLSGNAQTVRFWARGWSVAFPETFEVLYSTTDTKPESFVKIDNVGNYPSDGTIPEEWTEFTADLPASALHFAIRHISPDSYALYVDDLTYEAPSAYPADLALTGYNVYRDGALLENVAATAHTDLPGADGNYAYRVSAVYNHGESRACEAAEVDFKYDALTDLAADGIAVSAGRGAITVTAPAATTVTIVSADGRIMHRGTGSATVAVAPGLYLVQAATHTVKATVR